jgi:hypothetical protein
MACSMRLTASLKNEEARSLCGTGLLASRTGKKAMHQRVSNNGFEAATQTQIVLFICSPPINGNRARISDARSRPNAGAVAGSHLHDFGQAYTTGKTNHG